MGRAPCCDKENVKRGPWSPEEDRVLKTYIEKYGTGGNWIALPHKAGLRRCGKSCRLRWLNYLRPGIKHGGFTEEEDNIISTLYQTMGSRWSVIAARLPGRTDNDVKNYWNTKLKKKVVSPSQPKMIKSTTANKPSNDIPAAIAPAIPTLKAESYELSSSNSNSSSFLMESDLNLIISPNFSEPSNGYVLSPTQDVSAASAASSSLTVENIGGGGGDGGYDELFLDMPFWSTSDLYDWCDLREYRTNGENNSHSKQQELHQGFTYI